MISGDDLKYRNGLGFWVMAAGYAPALPGSSRFALTPPRQVFIRIRRYTTVARPDYTSGRRLRDAHTVQHTARWADSFFHFPDVAYVNVFHAAKTIYYAHHGFAVLHVAQDLEYLVAIGDPGTFCKDDSRTCRGACG